MLTFPDQSIILDFRNHVTSHGGREFRPHLDTLFGALAIMRLSAATKILLLRDPDKGAAIWFSVNDHRYVITYLMADDIAERRIEFRDGSLKGVILKRFYGISHPREVSELFEQLISTVPALKLPALV